MNILFHIIPILLFSIPAIANPTSNRFDPILPNSNNLYTFYMNQGEDYNFFVIGNGRTDVDCFVYDQSGEEIEKDITVSDVCHLSGNASSAGKYKLKIVNIGNYTNHISIMGF